MKIYSVYASSLHEGERLGELRVALYADYATLTETAEQRLDALTKTLELMLMLDARIAQLEAHLRRADDIEHNISAEDWYKERDDLLTSVETEG